MKNSISLKALKSSLILWITKPGTFKQGVAVLSSSCTCLPSVNIFPEVIFLLKEKVAETCFHCEILISQVWYNCHFLKGHCILVPSLPVSFWLCSQCHGNRSMPLRHLRGPSSYSASWVTNNLRKTLKVAERATVRLIFIFLSLPWCHRESFKYALIIYRFAENTWTHKFNDAVFWSPCKASLGLHHNIRRALL